MDDLVALEGEIESISKQKAKQSHPEISRDRYGGADIVRSYYCARKGFQKLEERLSTKLGGSKGPAKGAT